VDGLTREIMQFLVDDDYALSELVGLARGHVLGDDDAVAVLARVTGEMVRKRFAEVHVFDMTGRSRARLSTSEALDALASADLWVVPGVHHLWLRATPEGERAFYRN